MKVESTKAEIKNESPNIANAVLADSAFVIMHKGAVNKNIFFSNVEQARNWIKFNYPKRRFKEPEENVFVCSNYGTTFKIVEIRHFR
jgi:hypothetical protein